MVIGTSILVVEDDHDVLESIRELLEDSGYQVTAARNGVEALAVLAQMAPPAAMLVDSLMAEMSGAEFLKACAADPKLAGIPAIVISTDATPNRIERLMALGARGYVTKPFRPESLRAELERTLGAPCD